MEGTYSNECQSDQNKNILNWVDPKDKSGEFKRAASSFRDWIEDKPDAQYPPEKGRYHLYVSYACPWGMFSLLY
jgi:glutathionyl-hydroquinone reductase